MAKKRAKKRNDCTNCGKSLRRSQWKGKRLKSCPRCSLENGKQHVFHTFPGAFGQSEKRANTKEMAQSHCSAHRGNQEPEKGRRCSAVISC